MENSNEVLSIACHDCNIKGFIENLELIEVSYCPKCGGKNITVQDNKKSFIQ